MRLETVSKLQAFLGIVTMEPTEGPDNVRGWLDLKMATGRYSTLLVAQLARCVEERSCNIFWILDEIEVLEGTLDACYSRTKPPSRFNGQILRGLWHNHHAQAFFLPRNIQLFWNNNYTDAEFNAIMTDHSIQRDRKLLPIVHTYHFESYEKRAADQEFTGEWIIYAIHNTVNY